MTYMFEVYYKKPRDEKQEDDITTLAREHGGRLDCWEQIGDQGGGICLTYEFEALQEAERAATLLRGQGWHVEGPGAYGE